MTFQLTPLLDLLLIVIFAQYMDVQQNAASAESELQKQQQALQQKEEQLHAELAQREQQLQETLTRRTESMDEQREEYERRFQDLLNQQHQAGSALADALRLPGEVIEQLTRLRSSGRTADAQQLAAAAERLKQAIQADGEQLVRFILRFDEMQKRVSVWEVHLKDNGQASISDGEQSHDFGFESQEEFVSRAFQASKSFASPRPLVLLFLSYGDTQAGYRFRATSAMPSLVEQLRQDSGLTRWFDFSLMGFRPQGPVFQTTPDIN